MYLYEDILNSVSLDTAIKCLIVVEQDFISCKCYYDVIQCLNHYDIHYGDDLSNNDIDKALMTLQQVEYEDIHVLYEIEDMINRSQQQGVDLSVF